MSHKPQAEYPGLQLATSGEWRQDLFLSDWLDKNNENRMFIIDPTDNSSFTSSLPRLSPDSDPVLWSNYQERSTLSSLSWRDHARHDTDMLGVQPSHRGPVHHEGRGLHPPRTLSQVRVRELVGLVVTFYFCLTKNSQTGTLTFTSSINADTFRNESQTFLTQFCN